MAGPEDFVRSSRLSTLGGRVSDIEAAYVAKTTAALQLYANGTSGSDSNDGLSSGAPKKTLQAVFDLVPEFVSQDVVINLSGTFVAEGTNVNLNCYGDGSKFVMIDGGSSTEVVAGPWTADISSASTIGNSGLSLTPDQYQGYWIEVTSGSLSGYRAHIYEHSATTFTFGIDIGNAGAATFQVVRPSTIISDSGGFNIIRPRAYGDVNMIWQRLRFTGSNTRLLGSGSCITFAMNGIVWDGAGLIQLDNFPQIALGYGFIRTTSAPSVVDTSQKLGFSQQSGSAQMILNNVFTANPQCAQIHDLAATSSKRLFFYTTRFSGSGGGCELTSCKGDFRTLSSAYRDCKSEDFPIDVERCNFRFRSTMDLSNSSSHAIIAERSSLSIEAAITGTGNAGAGLYIHSMSKATIADGSPPTVTGTVGDISFDGTTSASTWATVDGGTPASSSVEFSSVSEV